MDFDLSPAWATTWSARAVILRSLQEAEDVAPDPAAEVIVVDLAESSVNLRARWWTRSRIAEGLNAQDRVLTRVKAALAAAGIDLPYPTRQILFHDQTEETDGDPRRQREGWPAGEGDVPRPRRLADAIQEVGREPRAAGRTVLGGMARPRTSATNGHPERRIRVHCRDLPPHRSPAPLLGRGGRERRRRWRSTPAHPDPSVARRASSAEHLAARGPRPAARFIPARVHSAGSRAGSAAARAPSSQKSCPSYQKIADCW